LRALAEHALDDVSREILERHAENLDGQAAALERARSCPLLRWSKHNCAHRFARGSCGAQDRSGG
jgi:hypothetical protein